MRESELGYILHDPIILRGPPLLVLELSGSMLQPQVQTDSTVSHSVAYTRISLLLSLPPTIFWGEGYTHILETEGSDTKEISYAISRNPIANWDRTAFLHPSMFWSYIVLNECKY